MSLWFWQPIVVDDGGTQTLNPNPVSASWAVPTPTVFFDAFLTPSAVSVNWAVPSLTLTPGTATITAPNAGIANWLVPTASISSGGSPQTLNPNAVVETWAVPSVTPKLTIAAGATSSVWGVPVVGMTNNITLSPSAVSASWNVPAPTFTGGAAPATSPLSLWGRHRMIRQ